MNRKLFQRARRAIAILLAGAVGYATAVSSPSPPRKLYSVQLGAYPTREEAQTLVNELTSKGVSPAFIVATEALFEVRIGRLPDYPSALLVKEDCAEAGYKGFIVSVENPEGRLDEPIVLPFAKRLIDCAGLTTTPTRSLYNESPPDTRGLPSRSEAGLADFVTTYNEFGKMPESDSRWDSAIAVFADRVANAASASEERGYWSFLLVLAKERRDGSKSDALGIMRAVAEGRIPAPPGYQKLAWRQVADMAHYTYKDRVLAHRLYREMLECPAFTQEEKAELATQLAATYLELLDSGRKGHPQDVRRACEILLSQVPETYVRERATIDLIRSETWFYEPKDLGEAVVAARRIQAIYGGVEHVAAQAAFNEMVALDRSGRLQDAIDVGRELVKRPFDLSRSFSARLAGRFDIRARTAAHLTHLCSKANDMPGVKQYRTLWKQLCEAHRSVITQYPGYGAW
jgi:hypothetical protein